MGDCGRPFRSSRLFRNKANLVNLVHVCGCICVCMLGGCFKISFVLLLARSVCLVLSVCVDISSL